MDYESFQVIPSKLRSGVSYTVNRMSFGRRLDLMRRVREIAPRLECFQAGTTRRDQIEAGLLSSEIDCLYLEWGLIKVDGLIIDGEAADPRSLTESGPEDLLKEALSFVKSASGLSSSEIKN